MAWSTVKQFNFRNSAAFVTDGANATYVYSTDTYSTTRSIGGENVTFGWDSSTSLDDRDRDDTIDVRLAGMNFLTAEATRYFRVDVPAVGQYRVRLAIGDDGFFSTANHLITDGVGGSTLATIQDDNILSDKFVDADGTRLTAVTWPSDNTQITVTLTGTVLCVYMTRDASPYIATKLAHLEIEQVAAAGLSIPVAMHHYRQQ